MSLKYSTRVLIGKAHTFNKQYPKRHVLVDHSEKRKEAASKIRTARVRRKKYGGTHPIHAISPLNVWHS